MSDGTWSLERALEAIGLKDPLPGTAQEIVKNHILGLEAEIEDLGNLITERNEQDCE